MENKDTLSYWLSEVTVSEKAVHDPEVVSWWPDEFPWGVETEDGVEALFMTEHDALYWRLDYINRKLNLKIEE